MPVMPRTRGRPRGGADPNTTIQALDRANTQAGAGYVQRAGEALTVRTDALALTIDWWAPYFY